MPCGFDPFANVAVGTAGCDVTWTRHRAEQIAALDGALAAAGATVVVTAECTDGETYRTVVETGRGFVRAAQDALATQLMGPLCIWGSSQDGAAIAALIDGWGSLETSACDGTREALMRRATAAARESFARTAAAYLACIGASPGEVQAVREGWELADAQRGYAPTMLDSSNAAGLIGLECIHETAALDGARALAAAARHDGWRIDGIEDGVPLVACEHNARLLAKRRRARPARHAEVAAERARATEESRREREKGTQAHGAQSV